MKRFKAFVAKLRMDTNTDHAEKQKDVLEVSKPADAMDPSEKENQAKTVIDLAMNCVY